MTMTFEQFRTNVEAWADERGIYEHSSDSAQTLKAVSEMGELADAIIKQDRGALIDALGDVVVCLVNVAAMNGLNLERCCEMAWHEIKDRKGHMVEGGAFVKE